MTKHIQFVRTPDDWAPSFGDNLGTIDSKRPNGSGWVRVSVGPLSTGEWRVSAWGADDDGMERDFTSAKDAKDEFWSVVGLPFVTHRMLKERGWIRA